MEDQRADSKLKMITETGGEDKIEEEEAEEQSGSSDGFVNPFEALKKGNMAKNATLNPEKFEELLAPKLAALQAKLDDGIAKVYNKIDENENRAAAQLDQSDENCKEGLIEVKDLVDALKLDVGRLNEVNTKWLQKLEFDVEETK